MNEHNRSLHWTYALKEGLSWEKSAHTGEGWKVSVPDASQQFEFGEEEAFILHSLDGRTTLPRICRNLKERFGLDCALQDMESFCSQMLQNGLVEKIPLAPETPPGGSSPENGPEPPTPSSASPGQKPGTPDRSRFSFFRFPLFDPAALFRGLDRLLSPFRFLAFLLLPGVPLCLMVVYQNGSAYSADLSRLGFETGLGSTLIKILVAMISTNLFSKIIQGTVAAHFQTAPRAFGIRLLFGVIPRFYIEKAQIKRTERRARLWIYAASMLTRLGFFCLGTGLWYLSRDQGHHLAAYSMFFGLIGMGSFLFVANPLWKADGYQWLSSFLKRPKLREEAFLTLRMTVTRRAIPPQMTGALKHTLVLYALACCVYVGGFLGLIVIGLGQRLERDYQGLGVLIFLGVLSLMGTWLWWLWRRRRTRSQNRGRPIHNTSQQGGGMSPQDPVLALAAHQGQNTAGKNPKKICWPRAILLGLLGGLAFLPYHYEPGGSVRISPALQRDVHALGNGVLVRVNVKEGERVAREQVLGVLENPDLEKNTAQTRLAIKEKEAKLDLLYEKTKPEELDIAQKELNKSLIRVRQAQREVKRLESLREKEMITAFQFDQTVTKTELAEAESELALARLKLLESEPRKSEVRFIRAEIDQLKQQLRFFEQEQQRLLLLAPIAGILVTQDLSRKAGTFLREGDFFARIEDQELMQAEILMPEESMGDLQQGRQLEVKLTPYPLTTFWGRVKAIAPVTENSGDPASGNRFIRVLSELRNPEGKLKTGMTGFAKIDGGYELVATAFTKKLVNFVMIEMWSWLP